MTDKYGDTINIKAIATNETGGFLVPKEIADKLMMTLNGGYQPTYIESYVDTEPRIGQKIYASGVRVEVISTRYDELQGKWRVKGEVLNGS